MPYLRPWILSIEYVLAKSSQIFSELLLAGFAIVFFVPAALQLAATRASIQRWGDAGRKTPHTSYFSNTMPVVCVMMLGGLAFAFNVYVVLVEPLLRWLDDP